MKHVGEKSVVTLRNESESLYFTQQIWSKYQPTISKFYSQYGSSTEIKVRHEKRRGRTATCRGNIDGLKKCYACSTAFFSYTLLKVEIL